MPLRALPPSTRRPDVESSEALTKERNRRKKKKSSESCLSLLSGWYPPPGTSPTLFKRSRTTPFSMARALPTRLGSFGKFRAQAPLERNHQLTRRSTVALPTFVMQQNVAIDNFRLPIC